jgi:hypothetical protein
MKTNQYVKTDPISHLHYVTFGTRPEKKMKEWVWGFLGKVHFREIKKYLQRLWEGEVICSKAEMYSVWPGQSDWSSMH